MAQDGPFELALLGRLDLRSAGGTEVRELLGRPKLLALLAYLAAARPYGFHRRDRLLAVFWPDLDQSRARNALRQAVYHLRAALGAAAVEGRGDDDLAVNPAAVRCDVAAFANLMADGRPAEALELVGGDLLPGFHVSDTPEFERWLDEERDHFRREVAKGAGALAAADDERGNLAGASYWARRAVEVAPYDEEAVRRLLALLDRAGDRAGAVEAYERFARRMGGDLGVEPSPETRALVAAIRSRIAEYAVHGRADAAPAGANPQVPTTETPWIGRPGTERARRASARRMAVALLGYGTLATVLATRGYYVSTGLAVLLAAMAIWTLVRGWRPVDARWALFSLRGAVLQLGLLAASLVAEGRPIAQPVDLQDDTLSVVVLSFEPSTTLSPGLAMRLWQTYARTFSNVFVDPRIRVHPEQFTEEMFGQLSLLETPEHEIVRRLRALRPPPDLVVTTFVRYDEEPEFVRIGSFVRRLEGDRLSAPITDVILEEGHVDEVWHHALAAAMEFLGAIEQDTSVHLPDSVRQGLLRRALDLVTDGLATRTDAAEPLPGLDSLADQAHAGLAITASDVLGILSRFGRAYARPDDAARRRSALTKVFTR